MAPSTPPPGPNTIPRAQQDHARARARRLHRGSLPVEAQSRQEIVALARILSQDFVATISVKTHGAGADEHPRAPRSPPHGGGQAPRESHATVGQAPFLLGAPALADHRFPGQVQHGIAAIDLGRERLLSGGGRVQAQALDSRRQQRPRALGIAHQGHHAVAVALQPQAERATDETRGSGDEDAHGMDKPFVGTGGNGSIGSRPLRRSEPCAR
jgi:hypothetical protein